MNWFIKTFQFLNFVLIYKQVYFVFRNKVYMMKNKFIQWVTVLAFETIMVKNDTNLAMRNSQSDTTKMIHINNFTD